MSEVLFRYQRVLPTASDADDDHLFALHYPIEANWLRANGGAVRISVYRWPEFIARYVCDHLGMTVFEFDVWLEQQIAEQFGTTFDKRGTSDA